MKTSSRLPSPSRSQAVMPPPRVTPPPRSHLISGKARSRGPSRLLPSSTRIRLAESLTRISTLPSPSRSAAIGTIVYGAAASAAVTLPALFTISTPPLEPHRQRRSLPSPQSVSLLSAGYERSRRASLPSAALKNIVLPSRLTVISPIPSASTSSTLARFAFARMYSSCPVAA